MDEGRLHAYLDEEMTGSERTEVAEHLASCAACRERLDLARAVRAKAHEILRLADPPPVMAPDFSAVLARRAAQTSAVPAPSQRSRQIRPLVLPWAASVILALGVGWFAQEMIRGSGGGAEMVALEQEAADTEAFSTAAPAPAGPAEPDMASPPPAATVEEAPSLAASARSEEAAAKVAVAPADFSGIGQAGGVSQRGEAAQAVADGSGAGMAAADAAEVAAARTPQLRGEEITVTAASPPVEGRQTLRSRAAEAAPPAAPPPPQPAPAPAAAWPDRWMPVERAAAEAALGSELLTIEGLQIEGFDVTLQPGAAAVRVRQRLPDGALVAVLQRRAPISDESAFGPVPGGTLRRGALEATVQAVIPADSAGRLLERVR